MKIKQLLEFVDEDFKQMSQQATNIQQGKGNATDAQLRQQRIQQLAANQQARNAAPAGKPMNTPVVPPPATTPATAGTAPVATPTAPTGPTGDTATAPTGPAPTGPTAGASDATKFGAGVADATGALNRGAQGFIRGASDLGSTLAKGVGDVASATAGGIGQTIGAAAGGLGAGYHTARRKDSFGSTKGGYGLGGIGDPSHPDPYYAQGGGGAGGTTPASTPASSSGSTPASTAAGDAEIANLKASIQKIDQRLSAAKIPESKKR
jgi:hypothetical protein